VGQLPHALRGLRRLSTTRPSAPQFIRLALPTKVDGRASYATTICRGTSAPVKLGPRSNGSPDARTRASQPVKQCPGLAKSPKRDPAEQALYRRCREECLP